MTVPKVGDTVRLAPFGHDTGHVANFWTWIRIESVAETLAMVEGVYLNGGNLEGQRRTFKLAELDLSTLDRSTPDL